MRKLTLFGSHDDVVGEAFAVYLERLDFDVLSFHHNLPIPYIALTHPAGGSPRAVFLTGVAEREAEEPRHPWWHERAAAPGVLRELGPLER